MEMELEPRVKPLQFEVKAMSRESPAAKGANVLDPDLRTHWSTGTNTKEWILLEADEPCFLSHIRIYNKSVLEWEITAGLRYKPEAFVKVPLKIYLEGDSLEIIQQLHQLVHNNHADQSTRLAHHSGINQPAVLATATTEMQPNIGKLQPFTTQLQPTIVELQPSAADFQPIALDMQPSVTDLQLNRTKLQSTVTELYPNATNLLSTAAELQQSESELQPTVTASQPLVAELQPNAMELQPSDLICSNLKLNYSIFMKQNNQMASCSSNIQHVNSAVAELTAIELQHSATAVSKVQSTPLAVHKLPTASKSPRLFAAHCKWRTATCQFWGCTIADSYFTWCPAICRI